METLQLFGDLTVKFLVQIGDISSSWTYQEADWGSYKCYESKLTSPDLFDIRAFGLWNISFDFLFWA